MNKRNIAVFVGVAFVFLALIIIFVDYETASLPESNDFHTVDSDVNEVDEDFYNVADEIDVAILTDLRRASRLHVNENLLNIVELQIEENLPNGLPSSITLVNGTENDIYVANRHSLEYFSDGEWYEIEFLGMAFADVLLTLPAGDVSIFTIQWDFLPAIAEGGFYRVRTHFFETLPNAAYDGVRTRPYDIVVEFAT
ncbi:MAG: hypothetical protein FWG65_08255 [Turicibacter sp.]|nr:hypothetical protein [Turicibacter sp.]